MPGKLPGFSVAPTIATDEGLKKVSIPICPCVLFVTIETTDSIIISALRAFLPHSGFFLLRVNTFRYATPTEKGVFQKTKVLRFIEYLHSSCFILCGFVSLCDYFFILTQRHQGTRFMECILPQRAQRTRREKYFKSFSVSSAYSAVN